MNLNHRMLYSLFLLFFITPFQCALSEVLGTKWPTTSTTFLTGGLPLGGPAGTLPGNTQTWRETAIEAANRWNNAQSTFKLVTSSAAGTGICNNFGHNNLAFSSTACSDTFGDNTLAVTASWSISTTIIKADIIFNSNKLWGIYDGSILFSPEDFSRVAMHEMGHAMGLAHTKTSSALMFATASDTFLPTSDDVDSLKSIYEEAKQNNGGGSTTYLLLLILVIHLRSAHKKAD